MLREVAESSLRWNYSLEEILGLILVAGVVGAYSLMFALTRQPRRGWAIAAFVSFTLMAAMIWASPPQSRWASATTVEAGMLAGDAAPTRLIIPGFPQEAQRSINNEQL